MGGGRLDADRPLRARRAWLLTALLLLAATPERARGPQPPAAAELMRRAEESLGDERSLVEARMSVGSPLGSGRRAVAFRAYQDRYHQRAFVRVLSPEKDAGAAFLRLGPNLWVYLPQTGRTLLVPEATLAKPWLGGDFTHADVVRATDLLADYEHRFSNEVTRPEAVVGSTAWVVASQPRDPGRAAWARIVSWIDVERGFPLRREYYAGDGSRVRVLEFSDVREVEGRAVPHRWTLTTADDPPRTTRIEIDSIRFADAFDDAVFTTRQLGAPK